MVKPYKLDTELLNDLHEGRTPELLVIDCTGQDLPQSDLIPGLYYQTLQTKLIGNQALKGIWITNASEKIAEDLAGAISGMSQALNKITLFAFESLTKKSIMNFKCVLTNPNFVPKTLIFNNLSARATEVIASESDLLRKKDSLTIIELDQLTSDAVSVSEPIITGPNIRILFINRCTKETMEALIKTLQGETSIEEINLSRLKESAVKLLYDAKDVNKHIKIYCDETIPNAESWQEKFFKLNPELYPSTSESGEVSSPTNVSSKRPWAQMYDAEAQISDNPPEKKSKSEKSHPYTSTKTTHPYRTRFSLTTPPLPTSPSGSEGERKRKEEKDAIKEGGQPEKRSRGFGWSNT